GGGGAARGDTSILPVRVAEQAVLAAAQDRELARGLLRPGSFREVQSPGHALADLDGLSGLVSPPALRGPPTLATTLQDQDADLVRRERRRLEWIEPKRAALLRGIVELDRAMEQLPECFARRKGTPA